MSEHHGSLFMDRYSFGSLELFCEEKFAKQWYHFVEAQNTLHHVILLIMHHSAPYTEHVIVWDVLKTFCSLIYQGILPRFLWVSTSIFQFMHRGKLQIAFCAPLEHQSWQQFHRKYYQLKVLSLGLKQKIKCKIKFCNLDTSTEKTLIFMASISKFSNLLRLVNRRSIFLKTFFNNSLQSQESVSGVSKKWFTFHFSRFNWSNLGKSRGGDHSFLCHNLWY